MSFAVTLKMARAYIELKVPYYLIGVMVTTPGGEAPPYELTAYDKAQMSAQIMR